MSSSEEMTPMPPLRRRSSITRKSIVPVVCSGTKEVAVRQYIAEATEEVQEWQDLTTERYRQGKREDSVLSQVIADPPSFTLDNFASDLTEEDLAFIKGKPDYGKFYSNVKNIVEEAAMLKEDLEILQSRIDLNYLLTLSRLHAIADNTCAFNVKEPVWHKEE